MKRIFPFVLIAGLVAFGNALADKKPTQAYPQASQDIELSFPRDHASHPAYRTEWWYFTGVVATEERSFGYQFTVFRNRLRPGPAAATGRWATNQIYLAHLAVSDLEEEDHEHTYRFHRGYPDLAAADTEFPGSAQVGSWSLGWGKNWTIRAWGRKLGIELTLNPTRSPLLHGDGGYSRKGPQPGQASMYYSQTRMETRGTIMINDREHQVGGTSWFDHEVFSSQLASNQVGWDWFGLRLSDGTDLMLFQLREDDEAISETSGGTIRGPDGTLHRFQLSQKNLQPQEYWTDPSTGIEYPVVWRLTLEDPELELRIEAPFQNQLMRFEVPISPTYWEGLVKVRGTLQGQKIKGEGYMELTGYEAPIGGAMVGSSDN